MDFKIPIKNNEKLGKIAKAVSKDHELESYLNIANVNAMDRLAYSDHGTTHVKIVANAALRILRILLKRGVKPGIIEHHNMSEDDAEVVVTLAAALHDIGMAIHRRDHDLISVSIGQRFLEKILKGIYSDKERPIIISEILGAIYSHNGRGDTITVEAGILAIADALDMAEGRARIPFEAGNVDIHSVSAMAIDKVEINEGGEGEKPIQVKIHMNNSAGIFQVDELLKKKVLASKLQDYFDIVAVIESVKGKKVLKKLNL